MPARDPMEEVSRPSLTVVESSEIKWTDRSVKRPWGMAVVAVLALTALAAVLPVVLIVISGSAMVSVLLAAYMTQQSERAAQLAHGWDRIPASDTTFRAEDDCIITTSGTYLMTLRTDSPGAVLHGDMSALVRGVPTEAGLCLALTLSPERPTRVVDNTVVNESTEKYLDSMGSERLDNYITHRAGLWNTAASVSLLSSKREDLKKLRASVRGAVPVRNWRTVPARGQVHGATALGVAESDGGFYALGTELADWLVQMRTELAAEVGESIPGQFVAPIRSRVGDYRLGCVINPDTLDLGPAIGVAPSELERGLLVCGVESTSRLRVLSLLVQELLRSDRRVLFITSDASHMPIVSVSADSVALTLGRDLVLNPVDSDDVPRTEYVPMLLSALETLSHANLANSPDLELALGRAVALNSATLADVTLTPESQLSDGTTPTGGVQPATPNRDSLSGFDAIRTLYQASAARAFYGTQTVSMQTVAQQSLCAVLIDLGSQPLDIFAWDLLCIKLTSLNDRGLVVVLDSPRNLEVFNTAYSKRGPFAERLVRMLSERMTLVLCTGSVSALPSGVLNQVSAAVALRLKSRYDIAAATDLLGLKVIGTGLHSRARESVRESSFLSIMDDDTALLVRHGTQTAIPIRLDPMPELAPAGEHVMSRTASIMNPVTTQRPSTVGKTLIEQVAGRDTGLAVQVLRLLERYQPLTEQAMVRFMATSSPELAHADVQGMLVRLSDSSLVLKGSEHHSGVAYTNYRLTMKGSMALRQVSQESGTR
ncbi:MAG: hypothetical protein HXY34_00525 [Candidatus Thorarchaeota archaeon]|nr:hypothetical protein [Candidatus Thorarchaeota archaeon]